MIENKAVKNYMYESRALDFHCVVDDSGIPILAPSLFIFHLAIKGNSKNTLRAYSFDLAKFFNVLKVTANKSGDKGLDYRDLTDIQMSSYLHGYLKQHLQLADSTIERHIATLTSFYEYSYKHGLMSRAAQFNFEYSCIKPTWRKKNSTMSSFQI
jgi:site-specific recombinase XerD